MKTQVQNTYTLKQANIHTQLYTSYTHNLIIHSGMTD